MMAGIRGKDTKPEMLIRRGLHALGFRYRLHGRKLAGKPDLVLARFAAVIFVHGCFWHGHDCPLFRLPGTGQDFWQKKIATNQANDAKASDTLQASGWRVATVWECALRGKNRKPLGDVLAELATWLRGETKTLTIRADA